MAKNKSTWYIREFNQQNLSEPSRLLQHLVFPTGEFKTRMKHFLREECNASNWSQQQQQQQQQQKKNNIQIEESRSLSFHSLVDDRSCVF